MTQKQRDAVEFTLSMILVLMIALLLISIGGCSDLNSGVIPLWSWPI